MPTFEQLFEQHAAASFDKQMRLSKLVAGLPWQFNKATGHLSFGKKFSFPVQILGTEATSSQSWLWGWANEASAFPKKLLQTSERLRAFGEKSGIREFADSELDLASTNAAYLAMTAAGLAKADCFYRGPYNGGALFVLLDAPQARQLDDSSPQHIISNFTQMIQQVETNHARALQYYLHHKGYKANLNGADITGISPDGRQLEASFDSRGRLVKFQTVMS